MRTCDVAHLATELTMQLRAAFRILLQAWDYAEGCQRNAWDFAIEIHNLREHGLTNSDLRWLVCKGLAKHGIASPHLEPRPESAARTELFAMFASFCLMEVW